MKNLFLGLFLFFFSFAAAQAYSGSASLYLMADEQEVTAGGTTNMNIVLDTTDLLTGPNESVQTISAYITFPSDSLEVVGSVDYSLSSFATPYVNDVDNNAGSIELVRARDVSGELLDIEIIGTFQMRLKDGASGDLKILFRDGMNSLLLNNIDNSDVLGEVVGEVLTVSGTPLPPPADDDDDDDTVSGDPVADAVIFFSSDKAALAVGETALISIFLDSGSAQNTVSSTDLVFGFPEDLLEIVEDSVDISSGVFSSQTINTIDNENGIIELVLFKNPGVSNRNALIGTFSVRRKAEGNALIYMAEASALFSDDVNNTDVLDIAGSSGLLITDAILADDDDDDNDSSHPPIDDDNDTDGGGGGGGGGSGSQTSGNRSNAQTRDDPEEDPRLSTSGEPYCEAAKDFSGKRKTDGDIYLSWNRVDDPAVEGFEVSWQKDGSGKKESMAIPKVSSINFPGGKLEQGKTYSFTLVSIGTECASKESAAINISPKIETGAFLASINGPGDLHGAASENDPSLYSASMIGTPAGYANMKNAEVAGKSFSGVPGTPENGPVALAFVLISAGIGFVIFAKRRGVKN